MGGPPATAVRRGDERRAIVALTFDAGSDTGYAAQILDTLAANHIRATFGMTGRWAEANPGLVQRMVREGHQLLNHSYDHPSFTGYSTGTAPLSRAARLDQLARADAAVRAAAGVGMQPRFRPPYGDEDASVRADVGAAGYRYLLMWTVDSLGWKGLPAPTVVQRCLDQAVPGAIYLMHVGAASDANQPRGTAADHRWPPCERLRVCDGRRPRRCMTAEGNRRRSPERHCRADAQPGIDAGRRPRRIRLTTPLCCGLPSQRDAVGGGTRR